MLYMSSWGFFIESFQDPVRTLCGYCEVGDYELP